MTTLQKIEKQGYKVKACIQNHKGKLTIGSFAAMKDNKVIARSKISDLYKAIKKNKWPNTLKP
jgi:hypothetical protein